MLYVIQSEKPFYMEDEDSIAVYQVIKNGNSPHEAVLNDIKSMAAKYSAADNIVPVGTIEYVESHMKSAFGKSKLKTLEIPEPLQRDEYLKREYRTCKRDEIPETGYCFLKNIDRAKAGSYLGQLDTDEAKQLIGSGEQFALSEVIPDIVAEYRVIVYQDKIEGIQFYDGRPWIFPDVSVILNAINTYAFYDHPKAYTIDVGISQEKGTFLIEVHPLVCCGLYGYRSMKLPEMLYHGYQYGLRIAE